MIKIKSLDKQNYYREYYQKNRLKILNKTKKPKVMLKTKIEKKTITLYFD
jgi:DNA repair exonuclease SbcCD nuclease subunit